MFGRGGGDGTTTRPRGCFGEMVILKSMICFVRDWARCRNSGGKICHERTNTPHLRGRPLDGH